MRVEESEERGTRQVLIVKQNIYFIYTYYLTDGTTENSNYNGKTRYAIIYSLQ